MIIYRNILIFVLIILIIYLIYISSRYEYFEQTNFQSKLIPLPNPYLNNLNNQNNTILWQDKNEDFMKNNFP